MFKYLTHLKNKIKHCVFYIILRFFKERLSIILIFDYITHTVLVTTIVSW